MSNRRSTSRSPSSGGIFIFRHTTALFLPFLSLLLFRSPDCSSCMSLSVGVRVVTRRLASSSTARANLLGNRRHLSTSSFSRTFASSLHAERCPPPDSRRFRCTPSFSRTFASLSHSNDFDESCPLPFETLPYRGAEVRIPDDRADEDDVFGDDDAFLANLDATLSHWKRMDYSSAWVRVPASRASLVERLTSPSPQSSNDADDDPPFELHHVNATESTIVLKKWLRPDHDDKVPPFATHQVGCAGFVLSNDNELLLVREWSGPPSNRIPSTQWKLPGGLLDAGESFGEASIREVFEETGVECRFESVLAFWHRHGLTFGKSDLYVVCLLRPTTKAKELTLDPVEVSDGTWMHVDEFLRTQDHPLILHVLENAFRLSEAVAKEEAAEGMSTIEGQLLRPAVEIAEGSVQWPNRPPFPTYTGRRGNGGPYQEKED